MSQQEHGEDDAQIVERKVPPNVRIEDQDEVIGADMQDALSQENSQSPQQDLRDNFDQLRLRGSLSPNAGAPLKTRQIPLTKLYDEHWISCCDIGESNNEVFRCPRIATNQRSQQAGSLSYHKQWAQVFDLGDTSLICIIEGSKLTLHLVHWTSHPLNEFVNLAQQNNLRATFVDQTLSARACEKKFEEYRSARLIFDGKIVPDVQLSEAESTDANFFGGYILEVGTTANLVYQIELAPYFLENYQTIRVRSTMPIAIEHESVPSNTCVLRAFEVARDPNTASRVHIYGLGLSKQRHATSIDKDISLSVHMWYSASNNNRNGGSCSLSRRDRRLTMAQVASSVLGVGSHLGSSLMNSFRGQQEANLTQELNGMDVGYLSRGDECGAVALHSVDEFSLLVSIFSDGELLVRPISSRLDIDHRERHELARLNLLQTEAVSQSIGRLFKTAKEPHVKVTTAKICSVAVKGDGRKDQLLLCVAYQMQELTTLQKVWWIDQITLDVTLAMSKGHEYQNHFVLAPHYLTNGQDSIQFVAQQEISIARTVNCHLTDIFIGEYDEQAGSNDYSLFVSVWNEQTKENLLIDVNHGSSIIDVHLNQKLQLMQDNALQVLENRDEFIRRMSCQRRFHPRTIAHVLKTAVHAWKPNADQSATQELQRVLKQLPNLHLSAFRETLMDAQSALAKPLGFGLSKVKNFAYAKSLQRKFNDQTSRLRSMGFQVVVREGLGLSIIREIGDYAKAQYEQLEKIDLHQFSNDVMLERYRMNDFIEKLKTAVFPKAVAGDNFFEEFLNGDGSLTGDEPQQKRVERLAVKSLAILALHPRSSHYDKKLIQAEQEESLNHIWSQFMAGHKHEVEDGLRELVHNFAEYLLGHLPHISQTVGQVQLFHQEVYSMASLEALEKALLRDVESLADALSLTLLVCDKLGMKFDQDLLGTLKVKQEQLVAFSNVLKSPIVTTPVTNILQQSIFMRNEPHDATLALSLLRAEQDTLLNHQEQIKVYSEVIPVASDLMMAKFCCIDENVYDSLNISHALISFLDDKKNRTAEQQKIALQALLEYLEDQPAHHEWNEILLLYYKGYVKHRLQSLERKNDDSQAIDYKRESMPEVDKFVKELFHLCQTTEGQSQIHLNRFLLVDLKQDTMQQISQLAKGHVDYIAILYMHEQFKSESIQLYAVPSLWYAVNSIQQKHADKHDLLDEVLSRIFFSLNVKDGHNAVAIQKEACLLMQQKQVLQDQISSQFTTSDTQRAHCLKELFDQLIEHDREDLIRSVFRIGELDLEQLTQSTFNQVTCKVNELLSSFYCDDDRADGGLAERLLAKLVSPDKMSHLQREIFNQVTAIELIQAKDVAMSKQRSKNMFIESVEKLKTSKVACLLARVSQKLQRGYLRLITSLRAQLDTVLANRDAFRGNVAARDQKQAESLFAATVQELEGRIFDVQRASLLIMQRVQQSLLTSLGDLGQGVTLVATKKNVEAASSWNDMTKRFGRKRGFNELTQTSQQAAAQEWTHFELIADGQTKTFAPSSANRTTVTSDSVQADLTLCEARLIMNKEELLTTVECLDEVDQNRESLVEEIRETCALLSETGHYEVAFRLASQFNVPQSAAESIVSLCERLDDEAERGEPFNQKLADLCEHLQKQATCQQAQEVAQQLICLDRVVPETIAKKLHSESQIVPALRCLMRQDEPGVADKSSALTLNYVALLKPSAHVNMHEVIIRIKQVDAALMAVLPERLNALHQGLQAQAVEKRNTHDQIKKESADTKQQKIHKARAAQQFSLFDDDRQDLANNEGQFSSLIPANVNYEDVDVSNLQLVKQSKQEMDEADALLSTFATLYREFQQVKGAQPVAAQPQGSSLFGAAGANRNAAGFGAPPANNAFGGASGGFGQSAFGNSQGGAGGGGLFNFGGR